MRLLSLFLACQHLSSGTNLREWDDQSWVKVQAVPLFRFDWCKIFFSFPLICLLVPPGARYLRLKTTDIDDFISVYTDNRKKNCMVY
jgi:hypothetical protein